MTTVIVRETCRDCDGGRWVKCHACCGAGEVDCPHAAPCGPPHKHPCPVCRIRGEVPCRGCGGRGYTETERVEAA